MASPRCETARAQKELGLPASSSAVHCSYTHVPHPLSRSDIAPRKLSARLSVVRQPSADHEVDLQPCTGECLKHGRYREGIIRLSRPT